MLDKVLESNTIWLCSSCYSCSVRCPAAIMFTDIMAELKRLASKYGFAASKSPTCRMARCFVRTIDRNGRNAELELMLRYYFRSGPLAAFKLAGLWLRLLVRGRIPFRSIRSKDLEGLNKMLSSVP
jgi:heterodisulfide reductase subunit C